MFPLNDIVELLPFSADCCPDKLTTISSFCPALPLCICAPVISLSPVRLIQYDICVPLSLVWNFAHPVALESVGGTSLPDRVAENVSPSCA
ncbi:MAG TPA: hypothetical protein VLD84_06255 [Nitrososphaeraceae archaeon]|nr:hypothetical protein [Nitrososphaeraceae archaeon]